MSIRRAVFWGLFASTISVVVYLPVRRRSKSQQQALRRILAVVIPLAGGFFLLRRFGPGRLSSVWDPSADTEVVDLDAHYEDVKIHNTDGLVLDGRWVPERGSRLAAMLVPGRGGTKSSAYAVEAARAYLRSGLSVLMLSMRSQGASEGRFLSAGYREVRDIRGALNWLEERGIKAKNVLLHGWSSGGVTALRAAPASGVGAVVEEGAFADLPLLLGNKLPRHEGASSALNWVVLLASKALGVDFDPWALKPKDSAARLYREGIPLLIIQSKSATEVPLEHAELIREAHPDAELWALDGYEHVGAYKHPEYQERLLRFLRKAMRGAGTARVYGR